MYYIHKRTLYADTHAELYEACRCLRIYGSRIVPGLVPRAELTPRQALIAPGRLNARFESGRIGIRIERQIRTRYEPRIWKYANAAAAVIAVSILTNAPAW